MPSPPKPKVQEAATAKIAQVSTVSDSFFLKHQFLVFMFAIAALDNEVLIQLMMVFMLSCWVGYMLVYGVHPALHTPLMSVSNAISGQVILGGIFMASSQMQ